MTENETEVQEDPRGSIIQRAASLACGMLFQDGSRVLLLFVILSLSAPFRLSGTGTPGSLDLSLEFVHHCLRIFVLYLIGTHWIQKFKKTGSTTYDPKSILLVLFAYGSATWALRYAPLLLAGIAVEPPGSILISAIVIPGLFLYYITFFYFFPVLLGFREPRAVYFGAMHFIRTDWLLPIKVVIAPAAITLLLDGMLAFFSPENTLPVIAASRVLIWEIFFIISTYMSLAVGFVILPGIEWRQHNLEPYRDARFTTLALQAPSYLGKLLETKNGFKILFVALLLGIANFAVLATTPPGASIAVDSIELDKNTLSLTLQLSDPENKFKTFSPIWFSVAGPEGESVTRNRQADSIAINGVPLANMSDALSYIGESSMKLTLQYETTRPAEDMRLLEDLHLWYRSARLELLPMQNAIIKENTAKENTVVDNPDNNVESELSEDTL